VSVRHVFDLDDDPGAEPLDLFAEELDAHLHLGGDCLSSASTAATAGSCISTFTTYACF
jgi:hypothetical protein